MRLKPYLLTILFALVTLFMVVSMIRYPQAAFDSALRGLKIWWDVLFPSLLPFLVLSELMIGFGVVHFMGVLLEPFMRPFFNVPGTGGFVMAMGLSSGYPVGPKLATKLREQKLVTRAEGERLVCFSSTSDPLFIFGAVAVGFFHDATLGIFIAVANYLGAIILGIIIRFHDRKAPATTYKRDKDLSIIPRAFRSMHRARIQDKRPLGKLMGDAVLSSFQTMFVIGGFVILFSVMMTFFTMGVFAEFLTVPLALILSFFHLPAEMSNAFIIGFFEVTQSMKSISEMTGWTDLQMKLTIASAFVAWGGISVHAQVASIIGSTDMRYKPYFFYKLLHAFLAGAIAFVLWKPLNQFVFHEEAIPTFLRTVPNGKLDYTMQAIPTLSLYTLIILCILFVCSALFITMKKCSLFFKG